MVLDPPFTRVVNCSLFRNKVLNVGLIVFQIQFFSRVAKFRLVDSGHFVVRGSYSPWLLSAPGYQESPKKEGKRWVETE